MKRDVTQTQWTCDHRKCTASAFTDYAIDTPPGWVSFAGSLQTPSGGGPVSLDLCPKHAATFAKLFDIEPED